MVCNKDDMATKHRAKGAAQSASNRTGKDSTGTRPQATCGEIFATTVNNGVTIVHLCVDGMHIDEASDGRMVYTDHHPSGHLDTDLRTLLREMVEPRRCNDFMPRNEVHWDDVVRDMIRTRQPVLGRVYRFEAQDETTPFYERRVGCFCGHHVTVTRTIPVEETRGLIVEARSTLCDGTCQPMPVELDSEEMDSHRKRHMRATVSCYSHEPTDADIEALRRPFG